MTASSVEFFPCRVQLMGLPRSSSAAAITSRNLCISTPPSIAKRQRISRNLFGAPDPKEMKKIYLLETERQRAYVLQRYNFDTHTLKSTNEQEKQPTNNNRQCTIKLAIQQPTIIEQEFRQHEQRLQNEGQSLSRSCLETTPYNEKIASVTKTAFKVGHNPCEHPSFTYPASDRQKPYTRQSLLTESFNMRKNNGCVMTNKKLHCAEIIALGNCQSHHCSLKTLELSQSINSKQKTCDLNDKINELSKCKEVNNQKMDKIDTNQTTVSFNDNCTKLSLQLVVSTQNVS